jgi:hypothetical protein
VNIIFRELKAFKGGDIGIQIDIFGNCHLHRSIPKHNYQVIDKSDTDISNPASTENITDYVNEDSFIHMHS